MDWYKSHKRTASLIIWSNRVITGLIYCLYPLLLVWLFLYRRQDLAGAILVPGVSFVLLSLFRKAVNRKRPYEVYGVPSLIPKDTQGNSFPSRHVFSVFVIAMTWLYLFPAAGGPQSTGRGPFPVRCGGRGPDRDPVRSDRLSDTVKKQAARERAAVFPRMGYQEIR